MTKIQPLTDEEWKAIDKAVEAVIREELSIWTLLPKKTGGSKGRNIAEYYRPVEIKHINEGVSFNYRDFNTISKKIDMNYITYLTEPVYIPEKEVDASGNTGIMSLIQQAEIESASKLLERIEKIIFHGSTRSGGEGCTNFSTTIAESAIPSNAAAAAWTTAQNLAADLETAINELRQHHIMPPYSFIGTPGIQAEMRGNFIANIGNEYAELKKTYLENDNIIDKFIFSDRVLDATLAVGNQRFLLFKKGMPYGYVHQEYPIHRANIPQKTWEGDIMYALRWAGCFIPKNPEAWALCITGTTGTAY